MTPSSISTAVGRWRIVVVTILVACPLVCSAPKPSSAQGPPPTDAPRRELFVPFDELQVLLQGDVRRVFLTRAELDELRAQAAKTADEPLPHKVALLAARYHAVVESGRAVLIGEFEVEVLADGMQGLPLDLSGVGIRAADLDGHAAMLAEGPGGVPLLITEGRGSQRLRLELVLPTTTALAEQSLGWQVPVPPSTTFHLVVPGDIELKTGGTILDRRVDEQAGVTHFDLLAQPGQMNLVMSLNNRRLRAETTMLARGTLIDEFTRGYERLHAHLSMHILHGAGDEFRFSVPEGFDITEVSTALLARWSVSQADGPERVLVVKLREVVTERVDINIRADRSAPEISSWRMPKLLPLDTVGFTAVVGVLLEDRLASRSLDASGLIALDTQSLSTALPSSALATQPGMPHVRPVAAYYAPQQEFDLQTSFVVQPAQVFVTTNLLLTLDERGLEVDGGFALLTESEKLFSFEFELPDGWIVDRVQSPDGARLDFQRYAKETGSRVRVQFPSGLSPGVTMNILFHAASTPSDWLSDWTEKTVELPKIVSLENAVVHETGVVAVRAVDDLAAQPVATTGLIVLGNDEKSKFGMNDVPTHLAWRYTGGDWQGTLLVARTAPRMTSRVLSFYQITPEALTAHFELTTEVQQARTQRVTFSLPESTPAEIAIRGLDDTLVKETNNRVADGRRLWSAQLAEKRSGRIRLAIDFAQPMSDEALRDLQLPELRSENVAYQSGLIAVEGHPELDVTITEHPRSVDVGELVDAEFQVGKHLLGVFSAVGDNTQISLRAARPVIHPLPTTIVQRAELVSVVGTGGIAQTAARFLLRTRSLYLQAKLPPGAELWSVMIDGQPALPERQGEQLVIALTAASADRTRDLQIVFEHAINRPLLRGEIDLLAPSLWQRAERDADASPVQLADLHWELWLPTGFRLVHSGGTVTVDENDQPARFGVRQWWTELVDAIRPDFSLLRSRVSRGTAAEQKRLSDEQSRATATPTPDASGGSVLGLPQGRAEREFGQRQASPGLDYEPQSEAAAQSSAPTATAAAAKSPTKPAPNNDPLATDAQIGQATGLQSNVASRDDLPLDDTRGRAPSTTWALEGIRPLTIGLSAARQGERVRFTSLGVDPVVRATVIDTQRWQWLGLACGLSVFAIGLLRVASRLSVRLRYAGVVLLIALLAPPLTGWSVELRPVVQSIIVGLAVLLATSAVAAVLRAVIRGGSRWPRWSNRRRRSQSVGPATSAVWLLILFGAGVIVSPTVAAAQNPASGLQPIHLQKPTEIPRDAIIIPYDPAALDPISQADKLLVPYDTYSQLWAAAHTDDRLHAQAPPAAFAWSGAKYETVLQGETDLKVTGNLTVHVLADGTVSVPLTIAGGVLESLSVDGAPGRLQVVSTPALWRSVPGAAPAPATSAARPVSAAAAATAAKPAAEETLLLLHLSGRGAKELTIQLRMKIEKRGGWRAVQGRLPAAPATSLSIRVPQAETEVRLEGMADRSDQETEQSDQTLHTTVPGHGRVAWQWRAKIAQATVDEGMSVESRCILDVQEDALRFAWRGDFRFRRGRRESFTLLIPANATIERVAGSNVRGWSIHRLADKQQLTVDLLAIASERETLSVALMRQHDKPIEQTTTIVAPVVEVPDAMLQQGQIFVRRSSLLDLRTIETTGLRRIEASADNAPLAGKVDASPLPLNEYQAFQYASVPYTLELAARPTATQTQVTVQTLLKLSQLESTLESRLIFQIQDRPLHRVRITVPGNWKLHAPQAPVAYEWHVEPTEDGQQMVELVFASGLSGAAQLVLAGTLAQSLAPTAEGGMIPPIELPKIEVHDTTRQSGELVVASDPAFDVRADQLQGCEGALLSSVNDWLAADQRGLVRLVIHYPKSGAAVGAVDGQLRVSLRTPQVNAYSVTNVKVTDRAIEETILMEWTIRSAGIRALSVVVPRSLSGAQVRGPLIRSEMWTPIGPEADSPVRLQVHLQEDVMGQYCLIIENDRLLGSGVQTAPIPRIETGQTDHRFVTLENAGRDELLVAQRRSLESLERSQSQWRFLSNLLGGRATEAFVVREDEEPPLLSYATKDRAILETVGARIGIAKTMLVVDDGGAYRGVQEYRVQNRTEQYLEIELPDGARLWTASVAGEPVKPISASGARLRIPLIKTAAGDLDYSLTLKYGGELPRPGWLRTTVFPFIKTININVELSQVRLRLPESKQWLNFGGSMGQVTSEQELQAGWLAFRTRQINELAELLGESDEQDFSRARAASNLKQLGKEIEDIQQQSSVEVVESRELKEQLFFNNSAWLDVQRRLNDESDLTASERLEQPSNRMLLNKRLAEQTNQRSLNVASQSGSNFQSAEKEAQPAAPQIPAIEQQTRMRQPAQPPLSGPAALAGEDRGGQIYRYQQRLEQQASQAAAGPAEGRAATAGGMAGSSGLGRSDKASGASSEGVMSGGALSGGALSGANTNGAYNRGSISSGTQTTAPAQSGYLTSLETELPTRGREYLFTTPRGDVEISAQSIDQESLDRLSTIVVLLAGAVVVWALFRVLAAVTRLRGVAA